MEDSEFEECRGDSEVKNPGCSCRHKFNPEWHYGDLSPSAKSCSKGPDCLLLASTGIRHKHGIQIYMQVKILIHLKDNKTFRIWIEIFLKEKGMTFIIKLLKKFSLAMSTYGSARHRSMAYPGTADFSFSCFIFLVALWCL